jgi:Mg-chelatase subunit ChlD
MPQHDLDFGPEQHERQHDRERARRWRLIVGATESVTTETVSQELSPAGDDDDAAADEEQQSTEAESGPGEGVPGEDDLDAADLAADAALDDLYRGNRGSPFGKPAPDVARWLEEVRTHFPGASAEIMERDALRDRRFRNLLLQPDFLEHVQPDVTLAARLLELSHALPEESKAAARAVIAQIVAELQEQLRYPLYQALTGSLNRALRARRPRRLRDVNWSQTIRANLKHYRPELGTVIPERMVAYGRQHASLRDVILCVDQSSSMTGSMLYAGIYAAIMATVPALNTRLVAFSTKVVDLTDQVADPVDMLLGIQLRGGTDIAQALRYCQSQVTRPRDTVLVLVTDLYEGAKESELVRRAEAIVADGVQLVVLLALDDRGTPRFNRTVAQQLAALGVPAFACAPEHFPALMGAAVNGEDLRDWATHQGIAVSPYN